MKLDPERIHQIEARTEQYLHSAKRIAIDSFGADAAHGHAEVITRIALIMATIEAAEGAASITKKDS